MPVRIAPESSPPVPQTIAADPDGRRRWRRISSSESHTQYETRGCQSADDVNILTDSMALVRSVEPRNERTLPDPRSEEHTSELQSLMRISYAVFCLKKQKKRASRSTPQTKTTKLLTSLTHHQT